MSQPPRFVFLHISRHPLAFAGIIFTGFVNGCASFLLPVSIGEFFTLHYHTGSSKGKLLNWMGVHINTLEQFMMFFIALLIVKAMATYLESIVTYRQGELFVKDIRERIFSAQMGWSTSDLTKRTYGKYLLRYSNDMKAVQGYLTKGMMAGIVNLIFLAMGLIILSRINMMLTLILFSLLLIAGMAIYILAHRQKPMISASRTSRSTLLAFVARSLSEFDRIKLKNIEYRKMEDFNRMSEELFQTNMRSNKMESLIESSTPFLIFSIIGILLWQMTLPYIHIGASNSLMIVLITLMMQGPLKKLLKVPGYLNKGKISLEKIEKLISQKKENVMPPLASPSIL